MDYIDAFQTILLEGTIHTLFQPIVRLTDGEIIGYEALSRGPENSPLSSPLELLRVAQEQNKLWDLELLFRKKAIEKAHTMEKNALLFINVDPYIIKDNHFKKGFTREFLKNHNISPESIIFEITERTAIEDYKNFKEVLNHYTDQGYKIAIDDAGSGYSGFKTITETKPHFIKIDMDLIRDIDTDIFKQSIIKAFIYLSFSTNIKLIAEGIETKEELRTLIELGVYAGQGYFLRRPSDTFLKVSEAVKHLILTFNKLSNNSFEYSSHYHYIGTIVEESQTFDISTPGSALIDYFDHHPGEDGVGLIKDGCPVGIIMKNHLNAMLAKQYGYSLYANRPVSVLMDKAPLVVDYYTPINTVSKNAMARPSEKTYDNIIVTKGSKYHGTVSIKKLLQYSASIENSYARELNPLTSLPGNMVINRILQDTISYSKNVCVFYLDLDHFKIYNDVYGFENGDKILQLTANIICDHVKSMFPFNNFIGHIGGDDFVFIVDSNLKQYKTLCERIISSFDIQIQSFFTENDRNNGFIEWEDRHGHVGTFHLTSLTIAGLYGHLNNFQSVNELAQYIGSIKKEGKKQPHSSYVLHQNIPYTTPNLHVAP